MQEVGSYWQVVAVELAVSGRWAMVALQGQAPDDGVEQSPSSKCAEGGVWAVVSCCEGW